MSRILPCQYVINLNNTTEIFYISPPHIHTILVFKIQFLFRTDSTFQFRLATLQVLDSHLGLAAAGLAIAAPGCL